MTDAIDREQMQRKIYHMRGRNQQRRDGAYKCGYQDACKDALQKLAECDQLTTATVTRCIDCRHCTEKQSTMVYCLIHNRQRDPNDFCNFGEIEY